MPRFDIKKFLTENKIVSEVKGRPVTSERRKHAQKYLKRSKLAQSIDVDENGFKHRMASSTWAKLNQLDPIPAWLRKYARAAAEKYIAQTGHLPPGV